MILENHRRRRAAYVVSNAFCCFGYAAQDNLLSIRFTAAGPLRVVRFIYVLLTYTNNIKIRGLFKQLNRQPNLTYMYIDAAMKDRKG